MNGVAVDRILAALSSHGCRPQRNGAGWKFNCPCHDDRNASGVLHQGDKGAVIWCGAGCKNDRIVAGVGLALADLFDESKKASAEIVATYDYTDEAGALLFQVCRFIPKDFRQRRPDGAGGWAWNLKGVRRVLYRLPQVLDAARTGGTIYVTEGEKDADTLIAHDGADAQTITATTNPGGAGKWRPEYNTVFKGASVIVVADRDEPGRAHARTVYANLKPVAKSCRVVEAAQGKDLSDHLAAGLALGQLVDITPDVAAIPRADAGPAVDDGSGPDPWEHAQAEPARFVEHCTDIGAGSRFVASFGDRVRYCKAWRCWMLWNDKFWERDNTGQVVELAKQIPRRLYAESAGLDDADARQRAAKFALSLESIRRLDAMLTAAETDPGLAVAPADFDRDPWLLNTLSGIVDIRTGEQRPHNPAALMTRITGAPYDPTVGAPLWRAFLHKVLAGDADLIGFLQRFLGYCLVGSTVEQVFAILYGGGANGKTTLIETVRAAFGGYCRHAKTSTFMLRRDGNEPGNDLAALQGARLATACEIGNSRRLDEELVKQITGGEPITCRYLYGEFFTFQPTFKVVLACNHRPVIRGNEHAIWRRVRLIPFTVTIPDAEQDHELPEKLRVELPGILRWIVDGCFAWQVEKLGRCGAVADATAEYRNAMDLIADFLAEKTAAAEGAWIGKADLYAAYVRWSEDGKEKPISKRDFGDRLRERGITEDREKDKRLWKGLTLIPAAPKPTAVETPGTVTR